MFSELTMVRLFALLSLAYAVPNALGQAIDNVLVEIYHVEAQLEGPPLATYRIFIDLAEGYELQMVYGDERNQLELSTTTTFFNDTSNGAAFGDRIDADRLDLYPLALDSWLTIGAASPAIRTCPSCPVRPMGIDPPRAFARDGSLLPCAPMMGL
jgi:hypothetical protein